MDPNRNTCVHKETHTITCCKQCSLHPPTHSWVPFHWCQQLQLSFSLSLTHTPVEHLSDCTAHSRTPSSHELIGKAIKGSVGPARWRNVLFCYLASKLTKPVRSHLADAGWAIFIYFLLEKLDAGSLHCLPSNNEVILRGRLAGWDMNPPPTVYLGGGDWRAPPTLPVCYSDVGGHCPVVERLCPLQPPIRALVSIVGLGFELALT